MKGYNCKQHILLQKIIEKMTNLTIDEDRFRLLKESVKIISKSNTRLKILSIHLIRICLFVCLFVAKLQREYKNFQFEQPYQRALYNVNLVVEHVRWTIEEYLSAISCMFSIYILFFGPQFNIIIVVNSNDKIRNSNKTINLEKKRSILILIT
jgi:insulysin